MADAEKHHHHPAEVPTLKLNDGRRIPVLAFGTWTLGTAGGATEQVVQALEAGFDHIDTAQAYRNEDLAGRAIRESGIAREDLWVTTKWSGLDGKGVRQSAEESLVKLGLDYVDLYLVHHPRLANGDIPGTWAQIEQLKKDGLAQSVGVSNFEIEHLEQLKDAGVKPAANQILLHPYVYARKTSLIEYAKQHGIAIEAYSALIPLTHQPNGPVDKPVNEIAARLHVAPEQVLLAWVRAKGAVAVTTSSNKTRLQRYLAVPDIDLSDEDVRAIDEAGAKGARIAQAKRAARNAVLGAAGGLAVWGAVRRFS